MNSYLKYLSFVSALFIGIYFFCFNAIGIHFEYFPGDLGDGRLNLYFLEHSYKFFTGEIKEFWNVTFMYPEKNVLAYSDNLLGSAPIYWLFRFLSLDEYYSYQLWFITLTILNFSTCYIFLNVIFKNHYAAVLGSFVFAFSIALQSQMTHVQMFPRYPIPLVFLFLFYFNKTLNPKHFFLSLFFLVYQIYCGIYLGFMLLIPFSAFLITLFIIKRKEIIDKLKDWKWTSFLISGIITNVLILLPLMLPYMERSKDPSINHYFTIVQNIPTVLSHFFSQKGSLLWDFLSTQNIDSNNWWDHQIFAGGIATLALIIFTVYYVRYRKHNIDVHGLFMKIITITLIITFIFYLRIDKFSFYIGLYFLPGFTSMRALARIINIELLFFAIATAWIFTKMNALKKQTLIFFLALTILSLDNYFIEGKSYRTKVSVAKDRIAVLSNTCQKIPNGNIISYEPKIKKSSSIDYQLDAMLTAQKHNLKTINAYTGNTPGEYSKFWNNMDKQSREVWLSRFKSPIDTIYVLETDSTFYIESFNP